MIFNLSSLACFYTTNSEAIDALYRENELNSEDEIVLWMKNNLFKIDNYNILWVTIYEGPISQWTGFWDSRHKEWTER